MRQKKIQNKQKQKNEAVADDAGDALKADETQEME